MTKTVEPNFLLGKMQDSNPYPQPQNIAFTRGKISSKESSNQPWKRFFRKVREERQQCSRFSKFRQRIWETKVAWMKFECTWTMIWRSWRRCFRTGMNSRKFIPSLSCSCCSLCSQTVLWLQPSSLIFATNGFLTHGLGRLTGSICRRWQESKRASWFEAYRW